MSTQPLDMPLSQLPGYSEVAGIVAGRPLFHFGRVASFFFRRQEDMLGDVWPDIDLVMQESEPPHRKIGFRFHRAAEVEFSGFGNIPGLFFQSIKERGWEHLRFEVGDYEESRIHLFCHEISVYDPERVA